LGVNKAFLSHLNAKKTDMGRAIGEGGGASTRQRHRTPGRGPGVNSHIHSGKLYKLNGVAELGRKGATVPFAIEDISNRAQQ